MKIKLMDFKELSDFPSSSGIEFYNDHVYLVGDDANDILVLDKRWHEHQRINLFSHTEHRIPKSTKSDLEATTIVNINEIPNLLVLGSGSKEQHRNKGLLVDLVSGNISDFDLSVFYQRLKESGIEDLNVEAAATVEDLLVLGNRGNKKHPGNQLIITSPEFWTAQEQVEIRTINLDLGENATMGLSGLAYSLENDVLIFTASTEDTGDAVEDGAIGDSYIGVIENAYRKMYRKRAKINDQLSLPSANEGFHGYKMESVCIQSEKRGKMKLHMVADNDHGESYLFKVQLRF